jgi:citrate lyase beta subunit
MKTRVRRNLLFAPGHDLHKIQKAAGLENDGVIMDLEDSVAPARKDDARRIVRDALLDVQFGGRERIVRTNKLGSGFAGKDVMATIVGRPDAYMMPKVEGASDVRSASWWLSAAEEVQGIERGTIKLIAIIETARGVVNVREIASADPRLVALVFGAEDLAGDIGAHRTATGDQFIYASSAVVIHAAANGLQALDTPFVDLHDEEGLKRQAQWAADAGFSGKLAIHPRQLQPIAEAFTPSRVEVDRALRLIGAHAEAEHRGTGVFELDGKMVDMPMVRAAEWVLARARRLGLLE